MSKAVAKKSARRVKKRTRGGRTGVTGDVVAPLERDAKKSPTRIGSARFDAVMKAAERTGLLSGKRARIGARVSPALIEQAKKRTGIESNTGLIEFALASVALEDRFPEAFTESRGKADADLQLGF